MRDGLINELSVFVDESGSFDSSIELLRVKHDAGIELNKSEEYFFGKWRDLKKKYIAPISRLAV